MGWFSFYVLTEEGQIYSRGCNGHGSLGILNDKKVTILTKINFDQKIKSMVAGNRSFYLLTEEGQFYSCGSSYFG